MKKDRKLFGARLGYILMLVCVLACSVVLGGRVPYGALAALLLIPPAALLLAWASGRQLAVRHALDCDSCLRGTAVRYALLISNKGIIPTAWASVQTASSRGSAGGVDSFTLSLPPFGSFHYETGFVPAHRGVYTMSVEEVWVSDPFRLTNLFGHRPAPMTLTVLPKIIPISDAWKQRLDPQGAGGFFSQSSDEPAVDSRNYRYGDSPRRIHWNLTARRRELMVRQYESIESRRLLVVLDLSPFEADDPDSCEDTLIEACLSVVRYALERQIETTLVYAEGDSIRRQTGRDTRAFDEIHRDSARLDFSAELPLLRLLEEANRAQMIYLFCMNAPDGTVLSSLPSDRPVELAVVRTRRDGEMPLHSVGSIRVTELTP